VLAVVHQPTVHAATPGAGLLFVVFFALGITVLALIRERDIEAEAHVRGASGPGTTWLSILVIPLLGVAGLALALAAAFGPLAPWVGRALKDIATGIWAAIVFVAHKLADLFPAGKTNPRIAGRGSPSPRPLHRLPSTTTQNVAVPAWFWDALVAVAALVVLAIVVWFIRSILPKLKVHPPTAATADEERDSVFSWAHVFARLRAWLGRIASRIRRHQRGAEPEVVAAAATDVERDAGIRFEYRRLLVAARQHGHGRGHAETTNELELRLLEASVTGRSSGDLRNLTALYDHARYGRLTVDEGLLTSAQHASDAVIGAIEAFALEAAALQALESLQAIEGSGPATTGPDRGHRPGNPAAGSA
jgi:hypothetical protein